MSELEGRVAAAQATYDAFLNKPFEPGTHDCAKLLKFHMRKMGFPIKGVAKAGAYKSVLGMKRALRRMGVKTIGDLADRQKGWLPIAPASALPGDVLELESDDGLGSLNIVLTNGRMFGFSGETGTAVAMQPTDYKRAWRVPWKAINVEGD